MLHLQEPKVSLRLRFGFGESRRLTTVPLTLSPAHRKKCDQVRPICGSWYVLPPSDDLNGVGLTLLLSLR